MTLFELTREYLAYLVKFREMAPTAAAPGVEELRQEIMGRLADMRQNAQSDPRLASSYDQVEYALVVLADEIALTSDWDQEPNWRTETLEQRIWSINNRAEHFFQQAEDLKNGPQDVAAIFYLILGLGFTGGYDPDDPELEAVKQKLLALLPEGGAAPEKNPDQPSISRALRFILTGALVVVVVAAAVLIWQTGLRGPDSTKLAKLDQTTTTLTPSTSTSLTTTTTSLSTTTSAITAPATITPGLAPLPPPESRPTAITAAPTTSLSTTTSTPTTTSAPAPVAETARPKVIERQFDLQVGVFVGPLQSGRLADQLSESGLPARVELWERDGGENWYVVMVGPLDGMDQALRAKQEIAKRYQVQAIVKPRSPG